MLWLLGKKEGDGGGGGGGGGGVDCNLQALVYIIPQGESITKRVTGNGGGGGGAEGGGGGGKGDATKWQTRDYR